ncbi:hypothetical protein [Streptomyces bungoensis]
MSLQANPRAARGGCAPAPRERWRDSGALGWSFGLDGKLVVTFGGKVVTP